jgi:hypothetical protein
MKADLTKAKEDKVTNKRKRQEEEDAFAEFQLFVEFKRQRQQQTAPVHQLHAHQVPHQPPFGLCQPPPPPPPLNCLSSWRTVLDAASGRQFFQNIFTGQTQWETPI